MILVLGSSGLIGRHLVKALRRDGQEVVEFDFRRDPGEDIRNGDRLAKALRGVRGVVHLAAVSRVPWGEKHPDLTWDINVEAFRSLMDRISLLSERPWLLFGSSREVYGEIANPPVAEDADLDPLNLYARSKWEGERFTHLANEAHGLAQIVRFSNVYGCPFDHPDRVVPAFARAAALGGSMRVEGSDNTFDFTQVQDVVAGLMTLIEAMNGGESFPPIHFVSGRPTTLGGLADLSRQQARRPVSIAEAPSRSFDVGRFFGDPERARQLLGWQTTTRLEEGLGALIDAFVETSASLPDPPAGLGPSPRSAPPFIDAPQLWPSTRQLA
ncbi:MAG: NAD(P)-dependent oxidoreductase [Pseudomonadota bacterium]